MRVTLISVLPSNIHDPGLVLLFVAGAGAFAGVAGGGLEEVQLPRLLRSTVPMFKMRGHGWLRCMYTITSCVYYVHLKSHSIDVPLSSNDLSAAYRGKHPGLQ